MECSHQASMQEMVKQKVSANGIHKQFGGDISSDVSTECNKIPTVPKDKLHSQSNCQQADTENAQTTCNGPITIGTGDSHCNGENYQEKEKYSASDPLSPTEQFDKLNLSDNTNNDKTVLCMSVQEDDIAENVVSASRGICYVRYKSELQMPAIMHLITKDLSEPYSIYTYRYFIHNWPHLCFLAIFESQYVGAIVCKLDLHKKVTRRGYIAMLAVDETVRRKKIGSNLVKMAIEAMTEEGCDEVVLETEVTNHSALKLYENLGFVRDKRLFRYYLNGVDALRLKLWLC